MGLPDLFPGPFVHSKIALHGARWVRAERSAYACFSTLPVENRACDLHRTRLSTYWTLRLRSLFPDIHLVFPSVRIRVPGLLGEPTGCGPSPCAPAFPGSDYYAHTATPSGLGVSPRVSPSLLPARLPVPLGASHVHDPGLLRRPTGGGYPISRPRSAAPQRATG
jgi:hypothetical protein